MGNINKYIFFIFFLGLYCQAQQVSSSISTKNIEYGEPILLKLKVEASKNDKVYLPKIEDSLSYHLEVLSVKKDTILKKDTYLYTDSIVFSIYEAGIFKIPSQKIIVNSQTFHTQTYEVIVSSPKIDTLKQSLHDIKPIIEEPEIFSDYLKRNWVYIVFISVFVIIAIVLIILYYLEYKKKKQLKDKTLKNPDVVALKKLKKLKESKYLKENQSKKYYSELIIIVKEYIEARWEIRATRLLSDDLINHLVTNNSIKEKEEEDLKTIFRSADLAKFAKSTPSIEESKQHLEMVKNFVKATKTEFLNYRKFDEY